MPRRSVASGDSGDLRGVEHFLGGLDQRQGVGEVVEDLLQLLDAGGADDVGFSGDVDWTWTGPSPWTR